MTTRHLKKSMDRSSSRLALLLIPLLLACFAIAQSARAVTPEADGSNANSNMAEKGNALLDPSTGTENGAMDGATKGEGMVQKKKKHHRHGHPSGPKEPNQPNQPNEDNHKVISIELTTDLCGCDRVEVNGELHMQFRVSEFPVVGRAFGPAELELKNFTAKARYTSREYKVDAGPVIAPEHVQIKPFPNGVGAGEIIIRFQLTGRAALNSDPCPKSIIRFFVDYRVVYGWKVLENGKQQVTHMTADRPEVECIRAPAP